MVSNQRGDAGMSTYAEHMKWCKERAREYLEMGDAPAAYNSMVSDMNKHPETARDLSKLIALGMGELRLRGVDGVRSWIDGIPD
jgi:hypothetical protein